MSQQAAENIIPKLKWLASYPKSGNTWVRILLYTYKYGKFDTLNQIKQDIVSDTLPGVWYTAAPVPWGILNDDQRLLTRYSMLLTTIMCYYNLFIKTHNANVRVNAVDLIPDAITGESIYLVRDPRDVAVSFSEHMGASIHDIIKKMNNSEMVIHDESDSLGIYQYLSTWSQNVTSWMDKGKFPRLVVRYEDLLADTVTEFRKILCMYYGIENVDEYKLQRAVKLSEFSKVKKKAKDKGFDESSNHTEFFKRGTSNNWQDVLTEEQVRQIEQDHGEVMERLGYKLEYL
jgi:hypothetical protein